MVNLSRKERFHVHKLPVSVTEDGIIFTPSNMLLSPLTVLPILFIFLNDSWRKFEFVLSCRTVILQRRVWFVTRCGCLQHKLKRLQWSLGSPLCLSFIEQKAGRTEKVRHNSVPGCLLSDLLSLASAGIDHFSYLLHCVPTRNPVCCLFIFSLAFLLMIQGLLTGGI